MTVAASSLPELLVARAEASPQAVATRTAGSGAWREQGWAEALVDAARARHVMSEIGVTAASVVAVLSSARAEWPLATVAAQSLGAVVVTVATDADEDEVRSVHAAQQVALWIVEDEEQFDKVVAAGADGQPMLVFDPQGITLTDGLRSWSEAVAGASAEGAESDAVVEDFRQAVRALDPDQPAALLATTPTAADPSVEFWSHRRLADAAGDGATTSGGRVHLVDGDEYLSFLPPAWPAELLTVLSDAPSCGAVVNFGERVGGVLGDLVDVQPTVIQAPAELWDAIARDVQRRTAESGRSARRAMRGLAAGRRGILERLAGRSVRAKTGLTRVRLAVAFGQPQDETVAFFAHLGISVDGPPRARATNQEEISA